MRNDFIMAGGKWMTIAAPKKMAQLDQQISELIDGDDGGTWAPERPIAIGGQGMLLGASSTFTGGVRTGRGYGAGGSDILLQAGRFVTFSGNRTRKIVLHPQIELRKNALSKFQYNRDGALVSALTGGSTGLQHYLTVPQLRFHNGATIQSITFRWQLAAKPGTSPATPELFAIYRMDRDYSGYPTIPSYLVDMHDDFAGSVGVPGYQNGEIYQVYATLEDYWNGGRVKSVTFVPNRNNVIDTSAYTYAMYLYTVHPVLFHSIELNLSAIGNLRPE